MKLRTLALSLALPLAVAAGTAAAQSPAPAPAPAPTLRAEIAPSLQAAQKALNERQFDEALRQLALAAAVPGRTPYESYVIDRFSVLAASGVRDMKRALESAESALASPHLEPELRGPLMDQASNAAYGLKDYERSVLWARRALDNGVTAAFTRLRLAQALYLLGQHPAAAQVLSDLASRQRTAGEKPGEPQLRLQASNLAKMNDDAGYAAVLEDLLAQYPKPEIWADRLSRLTRQPGFDERLMLDALRLGQRAQAWTTPEAVTALAERAQRAGFVAEARQVVEAGFERGILGQGPDTAEHQALRQRLHRQLQADPAPDPKAAAGRDPATAFAIGWDLHSRGQVADGISLMQLAVQRGLPRQADDARLRLAVALVAAGRTDDARPMLLALRDGGARDGLADLARLWLLQIGPRS